MRYIAAETVFQRESFSIIRTLLDYCLNYEFVYCGTGFRWMISVDKHGVGFSEEFNCCVFSDTSLITACLEVCKRIYEDIQKLELVSKNGCRLEDLVGVYNGIKHYLNREDVADQFDQILKAYNRVKQEG